MPQTTKHTDPNNTNTDASGTANQHLQYMPYGESFIDQRATGHDIRFKFTGKERDSETGFDYFGARYYDSDLSIWLSVDPMSDMYPSTSPYMYVRGNPIMLVDPDGMSDGWVENGGKVFWDDNVNSQKEANAKYGNDAVHHEEYIANEGSNTYYLGKDGSVDASNGVTPPDRTFSAENGITMKGELSEVSIVGQKKHKDDLITLNANIKVGGGYEKKFKILGYGYANKMTITKNIASFNWSDQNLQGDFDISAEITRGFYSFGTNTSSSGTDGFVQYEPIKHSKNNGFVFSIIDIGYMSKSHVGADIIIEVNANRTLERAFSLPYFPSF